MWPETIGDPHHSHGASSNSPPTPPLQQPTQPVPSPWTQESRPPKAARLPLEGACLGPAHPFPLLHPCFLGAPPSPLVGLESGYSLEQTLCLHAGVEGWRGTAHPPSCGLPGVYGALAWPTWRDAWEDLLCQTQLPQPGGSLCSGACGGQGKSHLGSLWVLDAESQGLGPCLAGQSPCPLRGRALPRARQTALPCPSRGPMGAQPASPHLDWLIRLRSACVGARPPLGPVQRARGAVRVTSRAGPCSELPPRGVAT